MIERMTHDQYVGSVRRQAAEMAAGILAGEIPVLEGCQSLAALRRDVEVDEDDVDFAIFVMI